MTKWEIDPQYSNISFCVSRIEIGTVSGVLMDFEGLLVLYKDSDFLSGKIRFQANSNSICTRNRDRDLHLKSSDFLDCAGFPMMEFISKEIDQIDTVHYLISGNMCIKKENQAVVLTTWYKGIRTGLTGENRMGLELTTTLNRNDFNLGWSGVTAEGIQLIGGEVDIHIHLELIQRV